MTKGVFCGTLMGEFLPIQLIYGGKTTQCIPPYKLHQTGRYHTEQTTSLSEESMLSYIDNVREDLAVGKDQAALAIFDHFKGQLTPKVTQCLEKNNIQSVLVPRCCTDRLQPLDISVNKAAESFLTSEF